MKPSSAADREAGAGLRDHTSHRRLAARMTAECLCFRVRRVSRAITRIYDEELRPLGIQATQLTLLNAITMLGEAGGPVSRLTAVLAMDATTLSRNLRALERSGLVRITRLPADRRVRVATLTARGEHLVAEAYPGWQRAHDRLLTLLGAGAATELRRRFDSAAAASQG